MFTFNVSSKIILGLTQVKFLSSGPSSGPSENTRDIYKELIKTADPKARNELLAKATTEERKLIKDKINSLPQGTAENMKWRGLVLNEISRLDAVTPAPIVTPPAGPDKLAAAVGASPKDAPVLVKQQIAENTAVLTELEVGKETIIATTARETKSLKADIARLSDLNGSGKIDSALQDIVNEDVLESTISRITHGGDEKLTKELFKRVTGNDATTFTPDEVKDFQTKLRTSLIVLQKFTGGNAGLIAMLQGNLEGYMAQVKSIPEANRKIDIDAIKGLSPQAQTIIGALVTTGALILSEGVISVGHQATDMNAESFIKKLEDKNDTSLWGNLKGAGRYVLEALKGHKLALTFGKDKMSVKEFEDKVVDFTAETMSLNKSSKVEDIKNPELKKAFPIVMKIANDLGVTMENGQEKIQKALIQAYIQNLGIENQGSDWTAKLGLLFIGGNRDSLDPIALGTKYSSFNEAEAKLTERKLSSQELQSAGVAIAVENGKFNHTIPAQLQFDGDIKVLPTKLILPTGVTDVKTAASLYDFRFSDKGDGFYTVTLTPRNPQPEKGIGDTTISPEGSVMNKQTSGTVRNIRDKVTYNEASNKAMPDVLYDIVGHQSMFSKFTKLLSRGDLAAAKVELDSLGKKYKNIPALSADIKKLQADFDANAATWDTYMSGNADTRRDKAPKFDKVRSAGVLGAEGRLAAKTGFPAPSSESNFRVTGEYNGKQISEIISGQELTSIQFMTPRDEKGGNALHRISVNDGSFRVSEKTIEVTDASRKLAIVNGLMNSAHESRGIANQVTKLNSFLKVNKITTTIDAEVYKQYLIDGDIKKLGIPQLALQSGKGTKMIEARAMVAGNICLNLSYALGYPLFQIENNGSTPRKQGIEPVANVDYSATLNAVGMVGSESEIGINPLFAAAALMKRKNTPNGGGNQSSEAGGSHTTGGQGGPGTNGPGGPSVAPIAEPTLPPPSVIVPE